VGREIADFDRGSQYEGWSLPENRSKPCGSGVTTTSGDNREIASSANGLNWEGANCHPFQRIAFRSTDIFAD
jgi:hypothetical protein